MEIQKENQKKILFILLVVVVCVHFLEALTSPLTPWGEADDYVLPAISLMRGLTDICTPADLERAKEIFPEFNWYWNGGQNLLSMNGNKEELYPFYFPLFAMLAIPFVKLFSFLGIPGLYGFKFVQLLLFSGSIVAVLWLKNKSYYIKILLILLIGLGPSVFYTKILYVNNCIVGFLIFALIFTSISRFRLAALCVGFAAVLNITTAPLMLYVVYMHFKCMRQKLSLNSLKKYIQEDYKEWGCILMCYSVFLIPVAVNIYRWGSLTAMSHMSNTETTVQNIFAYLFDLNFGFLPYYAPFLILLPIIFVLSDKKDEIIFGVLSLCISLVGFSLMNHINCGMIGIARYMTWWSPCFLYIFISRLDSVVRCKKTIKVISFCSVLYVVFFTLSFFDSFFQKTSYVDMNEISKIVLRTNPNLYNPLYSTFNSRVNHMDGGYQYSVSPYICYSEEGLLKKCMVSREESELYIDRLNLSKDDYSITKALADRDKKYHYINFIKSVPIYMMDKVEMSKKGIEKKIIGLSHKETWGQWSDGDAIFVLMNKLPENFTIEMDVRSIFAENAKHSLVIRVGKQEKRLNVSKPEIYTVSFVGADKDEIIELIIPKAQSPKELGVSGDVRRLGYGFAKDGIRIIENK